MSGSAQEGGTGLPAGEGAAIKGPGGRGDRRRRGERIEPAELRRLVDLFFEDMVKYVAALINIRPAHGNRSMEIQDPAVRERVRQLTSALIGEGEPLK